MHIRRGDIFTARLDPVVGSEQSGVRPILIIQNNIGNLHSPTVIVAPITARQKRSRAYPVHVLLPELIGLKKGSVVLLEQIRTLDKSRLERYIRRLDRKEMAPVDYAIAVSVGLRIQRQ